MSEDFVRVLYDASYRRLVEQLTSDLGDRTDAEHAVQDAFVRALTHARAIGRADDPEAWLRAAAIKLAPVARQSRAAPATPESTDAAQPADEAISPPAFDTLVERVGRPRRRHALGGTLAAVIALAAVVVGLHPWSSSGVPLRSPRPRPTAAPLPAPGGNDGAPSAADIVRLGSLVDVAADDHGDLMTLWHGCGQGPATCRDAWRLVPANGSAVIGYGPGGDQPNVYAGADGFVIRAYDHEGIVVDDKGQVRSLLEQPTGRVRAADVLVRAGKVGLSVADLHTAEMWPLPTPSEYDGWFYGEIDRRGTVWAMPAFAGPGKVSVSWLPRGAGKWKEHVLSRQTAAAPGFVAVGGGHVAALSTYDGSTTSRVGVLGVSADRGRSWTALTMNRLPFGSIDQMSATSDGVLYVLAPTGHRSDRLYRSTDSSWTRFAEVPWSHGFATLEPFGSDVLAFTQQHSTSAVYVIDDAGRVRPWPRRLR